MALSFQFRQTVFKTSLTAERRETENNLMSMGFNVCEAKNALAAMCKIFEKANLVQFGFHHWGSFIGKNKQWHKVLLNRRGGSYVLDIEIVDSALQR